MTMLPLAHTGLTPPAVAGPGCNEWLGLADFRLEALLKLVTEKSAVGCIANIDKRPIPHCGELQQDEFLSRRSGP